MLRCDIPLLDPEKEKTEAYYDVRLGFCADANDLPDQRVFDIVLQGQTVRQQVDITQLAGGAPRALVLEFHYIRAKDVLTVEFTRDKARRIPTTHRW